MDELSRWVFTICCGTLLCGVVSVMVPNKAMEKTMSMVLGLFMLCCFLLPIEVDPSDFRVETEGAEQSRSQTAQEITDYFLSDTLERSQEEVGKIILKQLSEYGIKEKDIQIYIETEEPKDGSSAKLVVNITLPPQMREYHDAVHKALEYELGLTVRLEYRREEP